jgi:hypothetical protein
MWAHAYLSHQAVEDFGIRDLQRGSDPSGINADIESLQATLAGEAVHSALRIAALVSSFDRYLFATESTYFST